MYKNLIAIAVVMLMAAMFLACEECNSIEEQNKAIISAWTEDLNKQDLEALDQYVAEDVIRHCQATPEVQIRSLNEMKGFVKQWYDIFPDMKMVTRKVVAEGDLVAIWATFIGTQEAPMGPYPATGKTMESETFAIFRLEEGKIAEFWVTWDNVSMFHQLGLDPPPAPEMPAEVNQTE